MRFRWILIIAVLVVLDVVLLRWWAHRQEERRFDRHVSAAAKRYGLEFAVVKAIIWRESRFNPAARGAAGELGLMQIRKPAAEEWARAENVSSFAHEQLLDPRRNILAGSWYLGKLLKRYPQTDNALAYALADYNAGRTHVLRWMHGAGATNSETFISQIDFPGTQKYVRAVLDRSDEYRRKF